MLSVPDSVRRRSIEPDCVAQGMHIKHRPSIGYRRSGMDDTPARRVSVSFRRPLVDSVVEASAVSQRQSGQQTLADLEVANHTRDEMMRLVNQPEFDAWRLRAIHRENEKSCEADAYQRTLDTRAALTCAAITLYSLTQLWDDRRGIDAVFGYREGGFLGFFLTLTVLCHLFLALPEMPDRDAGDAARVLLGVGFIGALSSLDLTSHELGAGPYVCLFAIVLRACATALSSRAQNVRADSLREVLLQYYPSSQVPV
eukprot:Rhum_TRINITY_DN6264_c0_g1::Rhum_TRINITY_DN6264_c0_g1_i1::g.19534::m.19534